MNSHFLLPCGGFDENSDRSALLELLLVPHDEMSIREKRKVNDAMVFGDLYQGAYASLTGGMQLFSTDLGSPEDGNKVEIRLPDFVEKLHGIMILRMVVDEVMQGVK